MNRWTPKRRRLRAFLRRFRVAKRSAPPRPDRRPPGLGATIEWAELWLRLYRLQSMFVLQSYVSRVLPDFVESFVSLARSHPSAKGDRYTTRQVQRVQRDLLKFKRLSQTSSSRSLFEDVRAVWLEMLLCKTVDAFELYLTAVLRKSLRKNPGAMSDASLKVHDLLSSKDLDEALARAVEKQVYDASFSGLSGVTEYLERRFGVTVDRQTSHYRKLLEAVEVRHLVVHNGSSVSRRFLEWMGRLVKGWRPNPCHSDIRSGCYRRGSRCLRRD